MAMLAATTKPRVAVIILSLLFGITITAAISVLAGFYEPISRAKELSMTIAVSQIWCTAVTQMTVWLSKS